MMRHLATLSAFFVFWAFSAPAQEVLFAENFNDCILPVGWQVKTTGNQNPVWYVGDAVQNNDNNGQSMNGSCFLFIDDDATGDQSPAYILDFVSPPFDASKHPTVELSVDVHYRDWDQANEYFEVLVTDGTTETLIRRYDNFHATGSNLYEFETLLFDLSLVTQSPSAQLIFRYNDANGFNWWAGFDNVKITGTGVAYDVCANAFSMFTSQSCVPANTANAFLDGPNPPCAEKSSGGLWLSWTADFSGTAKITTNADFNDVVSVLTGDCTSPQWVVCDNRDEHGYTGESTYFQAQIGTQYYFRVSGQEGGFGVPSGNFCISVNQVAAPPIPPVNDECANALPLAVDANCLNGTNLYASSSPALPRLNELARHDVWYSFTAPVLASNEVLEVRSNANFSDIITVYKGGCNALNEVAANHKGRSLDLTSLTAGESYLVQISGTFATVEGSLCPQILKKNLDAPVNDQCASAISVNIGGACVDGNNVGATNSGLIPPCVVSISGDVWYRFVAPSSGAVRFNTGADFPHILAVWKGQCGNFENVMCAENPLRCDGFLTLGALSAGETYYVQIASQIAASGPITGHFCLQILDGSLPAPFEAMGLQVEEKCVSTNVSELKIEAQGGIPPYTFSGTPNGQTLASGETYLVVVSDAIGCEKSLAGTMDDCEAIICAVTGTLMAIQPNCHNVANGSLAAMVTGGTGPYTYLWSNAATTAEISNLTAGEYSATVTDALDCALTMTATILNPTAITATPTSIEQPHQGQSDGAIFIDISGGTGQYNNVWLFNGTPFITSEDLTNAPAGDYTLVITDGNGCTASFDFTLTETVGNQEVSTEFFTEVFPNPAQEKAWLAVAFPKVQTLHLTLLDPAGRVLSTWTVRDVTEQNIPLDLKGLPAGSYQLRVRTEKELVVEKVVVRH